MEEQRAKLNQMECNMKAPNVKKINLKHQTTSVDLKVTFLEEKKNIYSICALSFGPHPTNKSFIRVSLVFIVKRVQCSSVCFAAVIVNERNFCYEKKDTHKTTTIERRR